MYGFRTPLSTAGGLTRTFGLHNHFEREGPEGPLPPITRAGVRRIAGYFRPYGRQWAAVLACIGVSAGLGVLPPFCVARILDGAIPNKDLRLLGLMAGAMMGLAAATGLIGVAQESLSARVGHGILFDLRNQLYRRLQQMGLHFYTATRSGEVVARINNDVAAVQMVATGMLVAIVTNVATLAATSIALFTRNWRLALVAVMVVPAFYLPSRIVGGVRRRLSMQAQESQASLLAFLNERLHVGGIVLTNLFGQGASDAQAFARRNARVRDLTIRQAVVGRWLRMVLMVFSAVGPALVFWYGGRLAIREQLTPGLLVAFAALLTQLYRPLVQLASVYADLQAAFGVFDRIFEYLDMVPEVQERAAARPLERTKGHLVFEGVSFAYPPRLRRPGEPEENGPDPAERKPFALREVSFEISPGERVALVGPSGAGKTTLTCLVPRFYDPDAGRILLDSRDLRDLRLADLRRHIGMVTQETFLFHATIRENLLYARPDASQERLVAACRAANIDDFIAALPEGYETVVGERGFRLSGGEKQRLSIDRALLKDPALLILDEATSSLDATTEHLIQSALEVALHGRTSLIIAHRLSTILSADKIVVLDEGRVVEIGTHSALLERRGLYAVLFEQQFGRVLSLDAGRR